MNMIARVLVVDGGLDMKKFLEEENIHIHTSGVWSIHTPEVWMLEVPVGGVKIAELKAWLKTNYLSVKKNNLLVFWINGADNLSEQCQNVLLKPLEEARDEVLFVLTVRNESGLLPTIISRCRVKKMESRLTFVEAKLDRVKYEECWDELIQAWKLGPGASIALLDEWEKGKELEILDFFIKRLAGALRSFPSIKRVRILQLGLELKKDARLMVNKKLLLGRFLLEGWKISGLAI